MPTLESHDPAAEYDQQRLASGLTSKGQPKAAAVAAVRGEMIESVGFLLR